MPQYFITEEMFPEWHRMKRGFDPSMPTVVEASRRPPSPAAAEFIMNPLNYCLTAVSGVEAYRAQNPARIGKQEPLDITQYLPASVERSMNLREVKEGKKRIYAFLGPEVEKWKIVDDPDKTKVKRVICVTPQVIALSMICTKHYGMEKGIYYDLRFMADSEIIEEGVYGFSAEEVGNMRVKTGLKPHESLYMITSSDLKEASETVAEFSRLHDGMLEEGLGALLPQNRKLHNIIWKRLKESGFDAARAIDVLFALDSADCVHPLIPYSVPGALLKFGELKAYQTFAHMLMTPIAAMHI